MCNLFATPPYNPLRVAVNDITPGPNNYANLFVISYRNDNVISDFDSVLETVKVGMLAVVAEKTNFTRAYVVL